MLRFIERFALDLANSGMPRMAARVFVGILAAENGTRTASELAELLGISPAAVSGAVRYLEQIHLVTREREPGQRRDHYVVRDDMWFHNLTNRDEMLRGFERTLADGLAAVGEDSRAGARLDQTRRFFEFYRHALPKLVAEWEEQERSR
ncbi:MarR family transcriptional regulator [Saccharopolyspora taberi]|uniref:MarR family transcriptional regulator n=1 Tax=Saccharopolyspora taberi TaxID=60895 RepID=A0ABN3VID6_9PSEU